MAKVRFNRLKGNVDRLERRIAYVNRGIRTSKKFAENIDTPEKLRNESLAKLKVDEGIIKDLKQQLKEANKELNDFVAEERAQKGKEKAKVIEDKYAKLQEALGLQFDPTSAAAEKIKDDMEALVEDYQDALTSINKRPTSIVSARSKLTGSAVPTFGETGKATTPTAQGGPTGTPARTPTPAQTPTPAPAQTPTPSTGNTGGGTTGGGNSNNNAIALAKKEAAKTKRLGKISSQNVETSDYAERNAGVAGMTPPVGGAGTPLDTLLAKTDFWYDLPDYIFKVDVDPKTGQPGEIGRLLQEAVTGNWDNPKFLSKLQLTKWWQKNSPKLRERIIDREKYNDLKKSGEDVSKTDYGIYLGKQTRAVKAKARELAGINLTDEQAQSIVSKIYDGFLDDDPLAINDLLIPFINKTPSIAGKGTQLTGFGGQALKDYQTLQGIAKGNGFKLTDILPNISALTSGGDLETAVLRGLADGTLDINRIAQDARMLAASGQPQYVRDLLSQGYDLENIYAPYREQMARELDLDPNQIDLNDPTLRMGITDKGDMNIYDFKKALRQDNRWQYSSAANEEVSSSVLNILRDFGFQG
jgi:hypothetical protein